MDDLIRRKDVVNIIHKKIENTLDYLQHDALIDVEFDVDELPAVDAVQVVRCKNCKRWGTGVAGETDHVKCCEFGKYMVGENGYCVYGELRSKTE